MSGLLGEADALYALALDEFTPARDERAKALRKADPDLARRVKALRKPATAAWVVNQLVRGDAEQVSQVLAVGEALRAAQESMSPDELRALTKQRRQLTAAVTQRARALSRERGVRVSDAVAERVEATLTAAMLDEACAGAVRSGLLVADLRSTGVGDVDVAGAVAAPEAIGFTATAREQADGDGAGDGDGGAAPDLRVVPDPDADEKARAAAVEALEAAEEARGEAAAAVEEAEGEVSELQARALQQRSEIDELRRRLGELETAADETDDELEEAEVVRDEAVSALEEAAAERDRAQRVLDDLG